MFSNISSLNPSDILVHGFDDAQTSRIVGYLTGQGAPVIKWTTLSEGKKGLGQKTSKKWVFWGFHTLLHQNASQFYFYAPMILKPTR